MSSPNVEIVRRIYEAWNSNDLGLELFDPSFELHQGVTLLDSAGVFRGHDGLVQAAQELAPPLGASFSCFCGTGGLWNLETVRTGEVCR